MIVVGGWPGRQVIGLNGRFGVRQSELASGGAEPNPFLNNFDVGDDAATEMVVVVTSLPGSGTVTLADDGDFTHAGAADGSYQTLGTVFSWAPGGPLVVHSTPESISTTFGTVSTAASIAAAGDISSAEAVGVPVVFATGGLTSGIVAAGGIASTEAVGTPSLSVSGAGPASVVLAGGIASLEAVGTPGSVAAAPAFSLPPASRSMRIAPDDRRLVIRPS